MATKKTAANKSPQKKVQQKKTAAKVAKAEKKTVGKKSSAGKPREKKPAPQTSKKVSQALAKTAGAPAPSVIDPYEKLLSECRGIMDRAQSALIQSYWKLGKLAGGLKAGDRAAYGDKTIRHLAEDLGMDSTTLHRAVKFAAAYAKEELVPRGNNLTWGHVKVILSIDDPEDRDRLRRETEEHALSVRETAARAAAIKGKPVRAIRPPSIDSFLESFSRLGDVVSGIDDYAVPSVPLDADKVARLRELHERIGALLRAISAERPGGTEQAHHAGDPVDSSEPSHIPDIEDSPGEVSYEPA